MREESLFYRLTSENENSATELLCNLCRYDEYREIILEGLGLSGFPIEFDDIQTQQPISDGKIPDIKIENDKKNILIYIENKINKNYRLLKSQRYIYPQDLVKSNKNIKLIFLFPNGYNYIKDIEKMIKKYDFVSIVYWDDLLNKLEEYNKNKKSEIIDESIMFFRKTLKSIPKTNFTQEDILFMNNIENFRTEINTMAKEVELFANIIGKLKENLNLGFSQKEPVLDCTEDVFGYFFCKETAFLGYSFSLLDSDKDEDKEYVLSLEIHTDSVRPKKIQAYNTHPYVLWDDWYIFKIDQAIFRSEEREKLLLEYCEEILKEILKM